MILLAKPMPMSWCGWAPLRRTQTSVSAVSSGRSVAGSGLREGVSQCHQSNRAFRRAERIALVIRLRDLLVIRLRDLKSERVILSFPNDPNVAGVVRKQFKAVMNRRQLILSTHIFLLPIVISVTKRTALSKWIAGLADKPALSDVEGSVPPTLPISSAYHVPACFRGAPAGNLLPIA